MKGLSRVFSGLAVVVLAFGAVGVWPGGLPAAADKQPPIKLTAPSTVVRQYDALVGTVPVVVNGAPGDARPNSCDQYTYCDSIPLELSVPESLKNSDTEDYFLRLKIEWNNSSGNNVDAYIYDAPYKNTAAIASSATANMPETINLYRPDKASYILTVMNRSGANAGYKLTAAITVEPFGGAPDFGGVNENPNRPTTTTRPPSSSGDNGGGFGSDDDSDDSPTGPTASFDNNDSGPPPPLASVDRDESLSALARGRGDFESSLTAPDLTLREQEPPPAEPVSGATVALLGGLLPASIVGGGVFWLRRKGGSASAGF